MNFSTMNGPELVNWFNSQVKRTSAKGFKPVTRFGSRDKGIKRCQELQAAVESAPKNGKRGRKQADARITMLNGENPAREGSKRWKQFDLASKSATVSEFKAAGGSMGELRYFVQRKWVKLEVNTYELQIVK